MHTFPVLIYRYPNSHLIINLIYYAIWIPNITRMKNFLHELVIISSHNRHCLLSNQCFTNCIGAEWWVFLSIFRNHVYIFHFRLRSRVFFWHDINILKLRLANTLCGGQHSPPTQPKQISLIDLSCLAWT